MTLKSLQDIPWFALAGIVSMLSLVLYTTADPNFTTWLLSTYLTQALLYIVLGYAFMRGRTQQGFAVFLMAGVWLLNQVLHWGGLASGAYLGPSTWLLLIVQAALAYAFVTGYQVKFAGGGGSAWSYAALWLVFLFGVGKLWLNTAAGLPWALWGIAIAVLSLGYIVKPVEEGWAVPFQAIGTLLAVYEALTIGGSGLALL